jgi:Tol biopolymer transport system component/predicted Ser/Thr protein kinase
MSLSTGTRLGPYEILAPIGAGGMGEVYQARDTRLDRIVAVKISAEQFSERFEREARAVAALNHPHICTLYDVGPNYLVMEYIEGPTLAERIRAGAIPLEEALPIARQIAEALEAAHEKGIVHRDLKPANIKLTTEGKVKVLDFGLAAIAQASGDPASSPTLTLSATRAGMILGTAGYMSPEQARGQPADKRADIWSYGVVLYEMLTGRQVFLGETISDTLAAVLRADLDWTALPPDTPASIRRLLRRCLERDRKRRMPDIAVARLELDEPPDVAAQLAAPPRRRTLLPWAIAALLFASTAWLALAPWRTAAPETGIRFTLPPPPKAVFTPILPGSGGIAISPDGRTLAFVASQEGRPQLWVRRLDSLDGRPLPGTDNATRPFWSPDNRFLGFFADSKLKKIEVAGGPSQVVADVNAGRGGTWNREGVIVLCSADRTLYRVAAAGGQPVQLTKLDSSVQESAQEVPWFLPDGRQFLYISRRRNQGNGVICVASLERPQQRTELMRSDFNGLYAPDPVGNLRPRSAGWLLFLRDTTLFAQKLDEARLKLEGEAVPVTEHVGSNRNLGLANFSVSQSGVLVHNSETASQMNRLVWLSRTGRQSSAVAQPGAYLMPRLSPDAGAVAVSVSDPQTGNTDIWKIDLLRGIRSRFTFDPAADMFPLWSADGKQIAFGSSRQGLQRIYLKAANGVGDEHPVLDVQVGSGQACYDWSRDGRYILYMSLGGSTGPDLWTIDLQASKASPFLQTPFNESQGQFSPDGRWIAYSSDESGRYEIYVRSFHGAAGKFQISNDGGAQPRWRGDGKELYYVAPDAKMMAVAVKTTGDSLEHDIPKVLFQSHGLAGATGSGPQGFFYDVTRDGQRFLLIDRPEGESTETLTLVTNWQSGWKK